MILRKPYAFLIKHFRKINLVLLLLTIYIFITTLTLQGYAGDYVNANTNVVESILSLLSPLYFFILILILLITLILLYLLKRKDKPIKTYSIVLIEYICVLILSIFLNNYFGDFLINGYDLATARNIRGFVLIFSIPQYFVMLLLVIRTIGLDLNSFGFKHDQDLLANEEDREEVEVDVGFDQDKFKREVRRIFRAVKYFVQEHKIHVAIVSVIVLVILSLFIYRSYSLNKIYSMRQNISSNNYTFNIQNSYITTKDYRGDVLNKGKSYVIIDLDITNELVATRDFDPEKFILYVDDDYYIPTVNYNQRFSDLGPVFEGQDLRAKETANYFLIYEIITPKDSSSFLLKYQDVTNNSRLIRVKLQIKDISQMILRDTKMSPNEMSIPVNETETIKFSISKYEIGTTFPYTYEKCLLNNCPIYGDYTEPASGRKILYMPVNPINTTTKTLLNNFVKYGKMRYVINQKTYSEALISHVTQNYKGNYLYLDVSSKIEDATSIEIVFTIRNNQYVYVVK